MTQTRNKSKHDIISLSLLNIDNNNDFQYSNRYLYNIDDKYDDNNNMNEIIINEDNNIRLKDKQLKNMNIRKYNKKDTQKAMTSKNNNERFLKENKEFYDVVEGFIEFIEDIAKLQKKQIKKTKKLNNEKKTNKYAYEMNDINSNNNNNNNNTNNSSYTSNKRVKYDNDHKPNKNLLEHNQSYEYQEKNEKNCLYRFKDDIKDKKDFFALLKKNELDEGYHQEKHYENEKLNIWANEQQLESNKQYNKYHNNFNSLIMNNTNTNNTVTTNSNNINHDRYGKGINIDENAISNLIYDNTNINNGSIIIKDLYQRAGLANSQLNPMLMRTNYTNSQNDIHQLSKYQSNEFINLQNVIESFLQKNNTNNGGGNSSNIANPLLKSHLNPITQMNGISKEFKNIYNNIIPNQHQNFMLNQYYLDQHPQQYYHHQQQQQLSPQENNIPFEKKLKTPFKRAATHVAIAYFIYLKSFNSENLSNIDKSKMDPTYNARLLKERKFEGHSTNYDDINSSMYEEQLPKHQKQYPLEYLDNVNIQNQNIREGEGIKNPNNAENAKPEEEQEQQQYLMNKLDESKSDENSKRRDTNMVDDEDNDGNDVDTNEKILRSDDNNDEKISQSKQ